MLARAVAGSNGDPAEVLRRNASAGEEASSRASGASGAVDGRADLRRARERADVVVKHVIAETEAATDQKYLRSFRVSTQSRCAA